MQRYSRAILLGAVGGRGQEALLSTGVRLSAGGPVLLTAAAYLAASGTPVQGPPGALGPTDAGFLVEASELGLPAGPTLRSALASLNADAVRTPVRSGTLAALPDGWQAPRPLVAVGSSDGRWVLWAASIEACAPCLAEAVRGAEAPGAGKAGAIQAGALMALLFQRLVLGLGPPLSGLALSGDGAMDVLAAPECPHGRPLPADVLASAVRHLEACYPEEGCGVVLEGPTGARWVPLANAYARWAKRDPAAFPRDARSAFLFEPADWLGLVRAADARGERVAYVVHAHPEGRAAFSSEDRAQASPGGFPLLPGVDYLVVAIQRGRASEAVRVRWEGEAFSEQPVLLPIH